MRDALIYHVASGQAFFSGVALIALAMLPAVRRRDLARTAATGAGLALVAASATPLPAWSYAVATVATLA